MIIRTTSIPQANAYLLCKTLHKARSGDTHTQREKKTYSRAAKGNSFILSKYFIKQNKYKYKSKARQDRQNILLPSRMLSTTQVLQDVSSIIFILSLFLFSHSKAQISDVLQNKVPG